MMRLDECVVDWSRSLLAVLCAEPQSALGLRADCFVREVNVGLFEVDDFALAEPRPSGKPG